MLLCLASADMVMVRPTYDGGMCSAMRLCLAGAGMAKRVPPMKVGFVL